MEMRDGLTYFDNENASGDCSNLQDLVKEMSINEGYSYIIPSSEIKIQRRLGSGEFGVVQQAIWLNENKKITVAVKCLTQSNIQSNPTEFIKEARIMHAIKHENIVRLFGIVLDGETQMLVTELASMRSLLECLKDTALREDFLNVLTLCDFSHQICKGMEYLESKRLIHRDLAARNILVFSKHKVKISDFGLSRALSVGKTYYQTNFSPTLKLPIAWCAPESINFLRFTTASDVFSFAVCLWEMFSYGMQPWQAMTGQQILEAIDEPNYQRLERPDYCPESYYNLMKRCWDHDPLKRPKFCEIVDVLPMMMPIQVRALSSCDTREPDMLRYDTNDIITVLDATKTPFWKGTLNNGRVGFFDPKNSDFSLGAHAMTTTTTKPHPTKSTKKKSIFSKVLSSPSHALKFDSGQNDMTKHLVEDQEQLLPLTPTSPDLAHTFDNKPNMHFKFFGPYDTEHDQNTHRYEDVQNSNVLPANLRLISPKDQKILDQALEIAYKCSTKSMKHPIDKNKRKNKKKLMSTEEINNSSNSRSLDSSSTLPTSYKEGRHFTEVIKENSEILFTEESKEAYDNLVQNLNKKDDSKFRTLPDRFNASSITDKSSPFSHRRKPDENFLSFEDTSNRNNNLTTSTSATNAVPLPPKPSIKPSVTCTKRHVRKHPLIVKPQPEEISNISNNSLNNSLNHSKIEYENIECNLAVLNDVSLIKF
ncbi:activated Cdc42 kinase-like [Culicoides brevitarsis]|uniref:activated Cdc42 kinase-like n=1 Tax=Culicoides brevitarsis TaxID=469753 RepID=UPI00307C6323